MLPQSAQLIGSGLLLLVRFEGVSFFQCAGGSLHWLLDRLQLLGRFLGNVPNVYQQWVFNIYYLTKYLQLSPEELDEYYGLGDPIWQNYWTMAVVDSTNLLMQQLAIPAAG